jgi:SAM-dependent methyltransferase
MPPPLQHDYSTVTELPAARASRQQLARLQHRYCLAAALAAGRDVLEVGCGAGLGLGLLAREARRVTGGDLTAASLALARRHYNGRVPLLRLDAQALPFHERSFDSVILFETLYYLPHPAAFVAECARVLRPGGLLLIGAVNPDAPGFHPSPFARRYFSARELTDLLHGGGFSAEISGGFRETAASPRDRWLASLKRIAGRAGLIPKTMRGRETLKRLVFGPLAKLPAEILPQDYAYEPPAPINLARPERSGRQHNGASTRLERSEAPTGPGSSEAATRPERHEAASCPEATTSPERDYTILYALGRLQSAR